MTTNSTEVAALQELAATQGTLESTALESADLINGANAGNNYNENDVNDDNDDDARIGTTQSARFNILSTMVGGGCLSLPLAFEKTGNALLGPLILLLIAAISEFCFTTLVASARQLAPITSKRGHESFESLAQAAFGKKAHVFCMVLVTSMCFFGIVGYSVLLRDMLQPISDALHPHGVHQPGPRLENNLTMLAVVLFVTPLCTLKTLTALQKFGALSMMSVLVLGSCIVVRSVQCNFRHGGGNNGFAIRFLPHSWWDVLDAFPLFVSCYVCHYNIVTVHNELRTPTSARVRWWLRSTTWSATLFYLTLGFVGSLYAHCTPTGTVQGNILLDFNEKDPLLLVGRMCLALTITLAFPMLTIPARDILLRNVIAPHRRVSPTVAAGDVELSLDSPELSMQQSLLQNDQLQTTAPDSTNAQESPSTINAQQHTLNFSWMTRLLTSMLVLWSAAGVASGVASIDVVWDLLGSSLSMLLSYIIPCATYVVIMKKRRNVSSANDGAAVGSNAVQDELQPSKLKMAFAYTLLVIAFPLMIASTVNAIHKTMF